MPADDSKIGNLEGEALKRKERLKELKAKREGKLRDPKDDNDTQGSLPKPCFRSYEPETESLQENVLPKVKPESVEEQVQDHLEAGNPEPLIGEVDLSVLAPRKPDWDLKRDVAKKLEKLEKRTQRAIAELIRERLKSTNENLADVVNAAKIQTEDSDED